MKTIEERAKEYASKKADISLSAIYNDALASIYEEGYMAGAQEQKGNGSAIVAMMKIMDTVGVSKWEDLPGKFIRVKTNGWGSTIDEIGNVIEDKWFNLREFYATDKGQAIFVLDERPPEEKEED